MIKNGHSVFGIIKKKYSDFVKGVKYLKQNLSNKKKVFELLNNIKPNIIIHFGSTNPSFGERSKKKFFTIEIFWKTKNLIDSSLLTKRKIRLLFANSAQIIKKVKKEN